MVEKNDAKLGSINRSLVVLQAWLGIVGSSSEGTQFLAPTKDGGNESRSTLSRTSSPSSAFSSFTGVKEPHLLFSLFSQYTIRPKSKGSSKSSVSLAGKIDRSLTRRILLLQG